MFSSSVEITFEDLCNNNFYTCWYDHIEEWLDEAHLHSIDQFFLKAEKKYAIPPHLLKSIAYIESGRFDAKLGSIKAWPWTILVNGKKPKAYYCNTKKEALKTLKMLKEQNICNIDIGIMQINNYWHKAAFKDFEEALDPQKNIDYAAKFLRMLYDKYKNWPKAIGHYHSSNPLHHLKYQRRVKKTWGTNCPHSVKFTEKTIQTQKNKLRKSLLSSQKIRSYSIPRQKKQIKRKTKKLIVE